MTKTLAELRAESAATPWRQQMKHPVMLPAGKRYVEEITALAVQLEEINVSEAQAGPRKMGQAESTEALEVAARIEELIETSREYEAEVTVAKTRTTAEWMTWRSEHPARLGEDAAALVDQKITGGWCNADDLIADLGAYVVEWNGEPLAPGDYATLDISLPDLKKLARIVVAFYELGDDVPKALSALSEALLTREPSSGLPETSE